MIVHPGDKHLFVMSHISILDCLVMTFSLVQKKVRNVMKRGEFMGKKTPQQELLFAEEKVLIHVRHLIAGKKAIKLSVFLFQHIFELRVETGGEGKRKLCSFSVWMKAHQMLSLL